MADGQWLGNMKDKIAGIVGNQDPIQRGRTGENGDIEVTRENKGWRSGELKRGGMGQLQQLSRTDL
ncbi:hypothetical protein E4U14_001250 [Claviceps sp. LM454 group G7]|nr:hypothetical protein E4U14_001250 [Claviceps sp. LM454 group G7]